MKKASVLLAVLCAAGPVLFGFQVASTKGSIEGQMVDAKTNAPVKRAAVTLQGYPMRGTRPGQPPPENVSLTAETDASGHFAFRDLEAGNYSINGQRQGYVVAPYQGYPSVSVILGKGQLLKDLTVRLTPQAVITGKVLDEDGEVVQSAQVSILRRDELQWNVRRGGGWQNYWGSAQTNDLGEYRIPSLAPGSYVVRAAWRNNMAGPRYPNRPLPSAPESIYVATHYPSEPDLNAAAAVTVEMGAEVRGIDIRLRKAKAVRLRGRVEGVPAGSRTMPWVNLVPRDAARFDPFGNMTSASRSGDNTFEIGGVLPGAYFLTAQLTEPNPAMAAVQPVEVSDKSIDGLVLRLAPSREVHGTVLVEEKTPVDLGTVGVRLTVQPSMTGRYSPPVRITSGQFTLKDVLPVPSSVEVNGLPQTCYVKTIRYGGRPIPPDGVDLTSGEQLEIVVSTRVAELAGTVVDDDGKAAPNSMVALISSDATGWPQQTHTRQGGDFSLSVKPGEYQAIAWEATYMNPLTPEFSKRFVGRTTPLKLVPGSHETTRLTVVSRADLAKFDGSVPPARPLGSISGTVVDAKSGAPVKNATVSLGVHCCRGGSDKSVEADEQGRFSMPGVEPGFYRIIAQRRGYAAPAPGPTEQEDLTIVGDGQQLTNVVVKADPQAVIAGRIVDEYGEPLAYARVAALRRLDNREARPWAPGGNVQTDDRGEYRIANLPPGNYVVRAIYRSRNQRPDIEQALPEQPEMVYRVQFYPEAEEPESARLVKVTTGAEVPGIDMKLQRVPVFRVRGKLIGEEGGGQSVLQLVPKKARAGLPPILQPVVRGPEGAFEFWAVRSGSYYLVARNSANSRFAVQPVEVGGKHIDGLTVELTGGREVHGAFKIENGRGQVYFNLIPTIASLRSITQNVMDGDTTFTLTNVAPIPYTIGESLQPEYYWKSIVHGGRPVTDRIIDFGTAGLLEITVGVGAARVDGTVLDLQGKAIPYAAVALVPVSGAVAVRTGTADAEGKFYFGSLAPGDYRPVAWMTVPPGRIEDADFVRKSASSSTPFSVEARDRKTVRVTAQE
jgi:protocatechuate 3,4-dioxygenase beta subunit